MTVMLGLVASTAVRKFHCYWANVIFGQLLRCSTLHTKSDWESDKSENTNNCIENWVRLDILKRYQIIFVLKNVGTFSSAAFQTLRSMSGILITVLSHFPAHLTEAINKRMSFYSFWQICKRCCDFSSPTSELLNLASYCKPAPTST